MPRKVPYTIRKKYRMNCYTVKNKHKNKIFSKCTSKVNAIKQDKLLRAILYNPNFKTNR